MERSGGITSHIGHIDVTKEQEIAVLKKAQEELKVKMTEEITKLNKETNRLVIEKVQLFSSHGEVEEAITEVC